MTLEDSDAEKPIETAEKIRERIKNELEELGLPQCPEGIVDRFLMIEQHSSFNQDARMIREAFDNVIDYISKGSEAAKLSETQRKEGELAAYLHDIGKTSSEEEEGCCVAVIKLFSVENVQSGDQTVNEIVETFFPDQREQMLARLLQTGVPGDMTMRTFWDKHAFWTKEVLEKYPDAISDRVRLISASHHIDRDINPYGVGEEMIPDESRIIGSFENFIELLEERALIALDKYQAAMFRPNERPTHDKVMEYMRKSLKRYESDFVMKSIIDAIDKLGKENLLFPETISKKLKDRVK